MHGGSYAERVSAPDRYVARKPAGIGFPEASGIPLAGLTALQSLDALGVDGEDVVLAHAAAGVGSQAIQIARARGARVVGTASEDNHDYLRSLGAEPVTYGDGLADRVRGIAPDGVTAVLDTHGGDTLETSLGLLGPAASGRVVSLGEPGVAEHGGRYLFVRPSVPDLRRLAGLVEEGSLSVEVATAFPLQKAAEAWEQSMVGHTRGKIVLTVV